ncbi:hypothetical protein QEM13_004193 [Pseudomonas putida]|uniref:hypothetical protein n=1 Tax=Pseudomonas sp. p1(2021b) TaxID=2874628 RepID=UPI001CCC174C|nr:hypothetical protein [Pseudomonas sp. p1(2021b)]EKT4469132.1 hypothetical protein [Pseudomonas putida]EKT4524866.1 hypothetical protein [Pseudomonas putida]UBM25804.1 hypothetical protein K8374_02025 [Pseudomonas sp. p1(2021b)]
MAYATGLFPLLVADQVGPDNVLQDTQEGVQTMGFADFLAAPAREEPNKQVTKLGNADGLLIH